MMRGEKHLSPLCAKKKLAQLLVQSIGTGGEPWLLCGNALLRRKDKADTPIFTRTEVADLSRAADDATNAELGLQADWAQAFLALVDDNVRDLSECQTTPDETHQLGGFLQQLELAQ